MTRNEYNGWTNYETWVVNLWINNERGIQNYWHDRARQAWDETHVSSDAVQNLTEGIKESCEDGVPEAVDGTVYADLMNAALSEVNWYEIADSLLTDCCEDQGYRSPRNNRQ